MKEIRWTCATLGLTITGIKSYKTKRGVHRIIRLKEYLRPIEIVVLQCLCGSDLRRETFNMARVFKLSSAPAFWQFRWNVLYSEKLTEQGEEVMLSKNDFSQKRDGLKAKDLGNANRAILTVTKVETVELKDNQTQAPRNALAVTFAEFAEKPYWPNNTSIGHLIDALGEDENKWIGKKVPLEKVKANNPTTGQIQDSLWVVKADSWSEYMRAPQTAAKTPVKKSAARR